MEISVDPRVRRETREEIEASAVPGGQAEEGVPRRNVDWLLRPVLEQMLGRAGVEFSIFKGGKYKDMTGFWRSPTSEESERLQGLIDEIYANFVQVVVKGRSMTEEAVRELATGEVITGQRAIEAGLVDRIGDFADAMQAAADAGNTKPKAKLIQPKRSLSQRLMGRPSTGTDSMTEFAAVIQRLMGGGIYYLDPAYLTSLRGDS